MSLATSLSSLLLALAGLSFLSEPLASAELKFSATWNSEPIENPLDKMFNLGQTADGDKLSLIDLLLEDLLPPLYGQRPNNENGTKHREYKHYALNDRSNDDAWALSGQELITRSGFKYELYDAVADDGYITTVTRLVNPLADRKKLRQPPVLMEHGGTIDPTAYLVASSIQHFPERWPRKPEDGPMRSWNRSLAFVLANNGFDVFLAETRGANDANMRRIKTRSLETTLAGKNAGKNMTLGENIRELLEAWNFWSFSQDDIIAHELKSHMDAVFKVTGSNKLHLMTFSLSTPTSLAFLGMRPDYAGRIEGFVSMAPIVSGQGVNLFIKLMFETVCPLLPNELGTLVLTDFLLTQPLRELLVFLSRPPELRYVLTKSFITLGMGPSPKYQTLMDLNFLGHLLRRLSFKELKQMCQQMQSNKLQKFDYGPIKNKLIYKQPEPPIYDLSHMNLRNWIIVSAANDALSTPEVVNHLIDIANPKPFAKFEAPGYNHADLFAGWENDKFVNFPILRYFEQLSYTPEDKKSENKRAAYRTGQRSLDLASILPPEMMPGRLIETGLNVTRKVGMPAGVTVLPFDTRALMDEIGKNMRQMINDIGERIGKILGVQGGPESSKKDNRLLEERPNFEETKNSTKPSSNVNQGMTAIANPIQITNNLPDLLKGANEIGSNLGRLIDPQNMLRGFGGNLGSLGGLGDVFKTIQPVESKQSAAPVAANTNKTN